MACDDAVTDSLCDMISEIGTSISVGLNNVALPFFKIAIVIFLVLVILAFVWLMKSLGKKV